MRASRVVDCFNLTSADSVGVAEPTACKNNPILRAEHAPLIPPKKWPQLRQKHTRCGHCRSQTVTEYPQLFLGPCRAERPLHAPPPLRTGHFNKARCWRNWLPSVPLADTAVTQAAPPAQARCLGLLGVAWSPRPDPCAQRDGRSVQWNATGFAD